MKRNDITEDENVYVMVCTFNRFYKLSAGAKKEKTYEDFCNPVLQAFQVWFRLLIMCVHIPSVILIGVVTSGAKLDYWCRDELYEKYVLNLYLKKMLQLHLNDPNYDGMGKRKRVCSLNHYFNYISLNKAVNIKDGKFPRLLLNCASGKNMLSKFNDEQLKWFIQLIPKLGNAF